MDFHIVDTGLFKLDGGAMFGVVPKSLWSRHVPSDDNNLCNWAARCLLIQDGNRLVLIDTGLGDKQSEKFFGYYFRSGDTDLVQAVSRQGFHPDQVTDVILTHLHFDHVGGAVQLKGDKLQLTFPNARYWSTRGQWNWAANPNPREKASFLRENIEPIEESGQLHFIEPGESPFPGVEFLHVDGHTEKMLLPLINRGGQKFLYAADLLPSAAHIPIAWVMSYDVRPLLTMEEKNSVLERAVDERIVLIFEHDAVYEAATVKRGIKGIEVDQKGRLADFL